MMHLPRARSGFTLIEILMSLGVVAVLVSLLAPSLMGARDAARSISCQTRLRGLAHAWALYANDASDRAMPLAYTSAEDVGPMGMPTYWWGTHGTATTPPEYHRGFIAPYLDASLAASSALECPTQPWGTYQPQGPGARWPTSTYGYNGYYLSPSRTPGWADQISHRPWRRISDLRQPSALFVFADTMILQGQNLRNCALLDPPALYIDTDSWQLNSSPTTAFRHGVRLSGGTRAAVRSQSLGNAMTARADGSVRAVKAAPQWLVPFTFVGSASLDLSELSPALRNQPHYVPDATDW